MGEEQQRATAECDPRECHRPRVGHRAGGRGTPRWPAPSTTTTRRAAPAARRRSTNRPAPPARPGHRGPEQAGHQPGHRDDERPQHQAGRGHHAEHVPMLRVQPAPSGPDVHRVLPRCTATSSAPPLRRPPASTGRPGTVGRPDAPPRTPSTGPATRRARRNEATGGAPRPRPEAQPRVTLRPASPSAPVTSADQSTTTSSPSRISPASSALASWSPIADCTSRRSGRAP
jgi:hypothetical protein